MRTINKIVLVLILTGLMGSFTACSGPGDSMPGSGQNMEMNPDDDDTGGERDPAPDFTYTSLDGEEYTLSNLQGKVVYIFFFGANCPHCRDNGPVTESEIYQPFKNESDFVALGLDTWNTSASEVSSFKNVTGITYPLLLNAKQSLIDYYGTASAYDRSVVVDGDGNIAYMGTDFVNTDAEKVADVIQKELSKL